jgi:hypothetical protein
MLLVVEVVMGGKGRIALSEDVANVVDCGGVEATLGGVNDGGEIFGGGIGSIGCTSLVCTTVVCRTAIWYLL